MEHVASSTPRRQIHYESDRTTLNLGEIAAGDVVLIWTQNSFYRFLVTDAAANRGQLMRSGQPVSAQDVTLIGIETSSSREIRPQRPELQTGASAVFSIVQGALRPRLVTSPVSHLTLIKSAEGQINEFNCATWDDHAGFTPPLHQESSHDSVDSLFLLSWDEQ